MANIRLLASASVTVDGATRSISASNETTCDDLLEFSKDVTSTPYLFAFGTNYSFVVVVNIGDEPIIVQSQIQNESDYMQFAVPVGAHLVLPSSCIAIDGDVRLFASMKAYTASGTSRMLCYVGINAF